MNRVHGGHGPPRRRSSASRGAVESLERRTLLSSQAAATPASVSGVVYQDADFNGAYDAGGPDFGLDDILVYLDDNDNGQFDSGVVERHVPSSQVPAPIPDLGMVESRIVVTDLPGLVWDVDVTLSIQHSFTYDLEVKLISPSGRVVTLFDGIGGDFMNSNDFTNTTLDDEASVLVEDGEPPYSGRYVPMEPLVNMDGETANGTWTLRIIDWEDLDEGALLDWHLSFNTGTGERSAMTDFDGSYMLDGLSAGTHRLRQVLTEGYRQTEPAADAAHVVTVTEGQQVTGRHFGAAIGNPPPAVVSRSVFYNHSDFDGNGMAVSQADDNAIATDKQALLPGQPATAANITSYSRGINGVFIDLANLPAGDELSAADFEFRVGIFADPWNWPAPAVSASVNVRPGGGAGGSTRVTITWPDGTIVGVWLQVTVRDTPTTGLGNPDVFYFGNLPGETDGDGTVTFADAMSVRAALNRRGRPLTDRNDFTRDRRVDASDFAVVRRWMGRGLHLFSPVSAAPQPDPSGVAPVPSRRTAYRPSRVWDEPAPAVL